jgi:hypothetical protein
MSTKNQTISNFPKIANVDANNNILGLTVAAANIGDLAVSGNFVSESDIDLGNVDTVHIGGGSAGQYLRTNGAGNLTWGAGGGGNSSIFVTSNITAVVAGLPIVVVADFANIQYPGGVFTITQTGTPPPSGNLTMSSTWASGGTSKNAYANFAASQINTQNISVVLTLSGGATFSVASSDNITIGSSVITGTDLINLGITGNTDTIAIASSLFSSTVQTQASTAISASLTTSAGVKTANSNALTTVQPTAFAVGNIGGTFANSGVPFFNATQAFSWTASNVTGTVTGGTVTLSGTHTATLTTSGATSGNSAPYDASTGTFTLTGSYTGNGLNGAGITTANVTGNVATVSTYQPLLYKITQSNANPNFTSADTYVPEQWVPNDNQGAQSTAVTADRLWFAVPGASNVAVQFKFDQPPFIGITLTKDANLTYANQTINGVTYQVWGFKDFSTSVFVYTTN